MRINVAIPESNVNAYVLNAALEPVVRLNEALIQSGQAPSFDRALKNGHVQWKPEPPGEERFDHALTVLGRRWGDCDDLAPWHAASLRASGADPGARAIVRKSGPSTWHAVVLRSDGMIEDPSARAGMPTRGQRSTGPSSIPRMSARPSSVVGVVGAFAVRPEIAMRKRYDHGYEARVDIPWFHENRGKPSATEIAMATLHVAPLAATALTGAIDGACQLAMHGGYAHPEHLDRLCCIADRVSGTSTAQRLARVYGAGHARAAEAYCKGLVSGLAQLEELHQKKKPGLVVSVPEQLERRITRVVPEDDPAIVGGLFDSLARVALAVGTGGASEVIHKVSPQAGKFMDQAVKSAGRAIGKAEGALLTAEHWISHEISKIPYVGGPLASIFDAGFHAVTGPLIMTIDIAVKGKRLDQAVLSFWHQSLQDFKNVGPYVQMVISFVPGWGTAVSAAIGMGLALANGQPIDQAILAGASSMLPGGPLAKAAVNMAYAGIHAAVTHEKINVASLGSMAMGAAADALALPAAAKNALQAGVSMCGQLCSGVHLDVALSHAVVDALPIPGTAKQALQEADSLALDLAHGKRIDKALLSRVGDVAKFIPGDPKLVAQLANVAQTGASILEGAKPEEALMHCLKNGAADALISIGGATLPQQAKDALSKGLAIGNGVVHQARTLEQLVSKTAQGKLLDLGRTFAQGNPIVAKARELAKGAEQHGFDLASGLLSQQAKLFQVTGLRNALTDVERKGFDIASALRVGMVAHPLPGGDPMAIAAHAITLGSAANHPANRAEINATLALHPVALRGMQAALARKECSARSHDEFRAACMPLEFHARAG